MFFDFIQALALNPLVFVIVVLGIVYFFVAGDHPDDAPPMPESPYPFLGHLPMMRKNPREKMKEWTEKSGNIFSIYIGSQLTVVLSGIEVLKEAFVKQADIFTDRPQLYDASLSPEGHKGIITSSGENWKEQRTVTLSILRSFGMGKNSFAEKIEKEVEIYLNALSELKGEPSNIKILTDSCVSNVICNIIKGQRFELGDPDLVRLLNTVDNYVLLTGRSFILNIFPWLRFVPGDPFAGVKIKKYFTEIRDYLRDNFVEPIRKNVDDNNTDSLIAEYIREMRKRQASGTATTMDDGNLIRLIFHLFTAGTETSSTTIVWFVLFMIHHPDVLAKIYKEIEDVVGREQVPSIQERTKLNYLNACIMETQRLGSIAPFSLQHLCSKTTTVGGYTIPQGTVIMPCLDYVLRFDKSWGDPHNFRPGRFLDDSGKLKVFDEFVPFSLGRRVCLGESLAKMELFLFLARICQRFDIQPAVKGQLPSLKGVFGLTVTPEAYEVRFVEREM
ncbi:cytochrome P450 2B19 [Aplysia californica]|uniref:Cytochrome P450 2B19 n=1 Tax=Aplysia californica TaxID=6500 RepID=A0ABM0JT75_APLCA|nr:cytochrome P450 2B19 [Aplysia californica]XP_005100934.1 cytochrome P450 2B19 [Aplysia californica]XP_005100935.1 cytochrome P450 2B19 [Aplysia californica]